MDLIIAEEVSQLLKKKITLEQDLEKLLSKDENFKIGLKRNNTGFLSPYPTYVSELSINSNQEFINKLKWLSILEVQNQIEKITNEIKSLKYY